MTNDDVPGPASYSFHIGIVVVLNLDLDLGQTRPGEAVLICESRGSSSTSVHKENKVNNGSPASS